MQTQNTDAVSKTDAMTDGLRYVTRELLREPVKDAVAEALREEADVRSSADSAMTDDRPAIRPDEDIRDDEDGGGGGSKLGLLLVGVAAAAGLSYLVRQRGSSSEQSTWSEFEESDRDTGGARSYDSDSAGGSGGATDAEDVTAGESDGATPPGE